MKICIFDFHLVEFILVESGIQRFYDKKLVICHTLRHNLEMMKHVFVVTKLYAQIDILRGVRPKRLLVTS